MSNITDRHQARKRILDLLNHTAQEELANADFDFKSRLAIMENEILDEYLTEKIRSDKVIEGLLKDIRAEIERSGNTITDAINDAGIVVKAL